MDKTKDKRNKKTYPRHGEPQYRAMCGECRRDSRQQSARPSSRTMAAARLRLRTSELSMTLN